MFQWNTSQLTIGGFFSDAFKGDLMLVESNDAFKFSVERITIVLDEKSERIVLDRREIKLDLQVEGIQVPSKDFALLTFQCQGFSLDGRMKIYLSLGGRNELVFGYIELSSFFSSSPCLACCKEGPSNQTTWIFGREFFKKYGYVYFHREKHIAFGLLK